MIHLYKLYKPINPKTKIPTTPASKQKSTEPQL